MATRPTLSRGDVVIPATTDRYVGHVTLGRKYVIQRVDAQGEWIDRCDNIHMPCGGYNVGTFVLVSTCRIENPTEQDIQSAKDLPKPEDVASFFRKE